MLCQIRFKVCVPGLIESSVGIGEQRQVEEACADLLRIFLTRRYDGVAVCGNYELDVDYYFKYNGNAGSHVEHVISFDTAFKYAVGNNHARGGLHLDASGRSRITSS